MEYIELRNYSKTLKGMEVLSDINLKIHKAEIVGLLGRNASGKTMLLRAISGLILPTRGAVYIHGKKTSARNRFFESCGLIIETMDFWPNLTAMETLQVLCSVKSIATYKDMEDTLLRVGLNPKDRRVVKKFSLGMKQKLAIAQAIVEKPDLLLLDEPSNALDDQSRHHFNQIILEEQKRGATIVISTHLKEDLVEIADRIIEIQAGKILSETQTGITETI